MKYKNVLKLFLIGIGIAVILSCGSGGNYKAKKVVNEVKDENKQPDQLDEDLALIPVVGEAVKIAGDAVKEAAEAKKKEKNQDGKPIPLKLPDKPNLIEPLKPDFDKIRKGIEKNNQFKKLFKVPVIGSIISFVDNRGIGHKGKLIELLNDRLKIQIEKTKFTYRIKQIKPKYAGQFFSDLFVQNEIDKAVKIQENLYAIKRRKYFAAFRDYEMKCFRIKEANQTAIDKWQNFRVELRRTAHLAKKRSNAKNLFSGWDGSLYALKSFTKKNCKDPSSFDHILTSYVTLPSHLIVMMKYRAKNSFGGFSIGHITATVDFDGNLLTIVKAE